MRPHELKNMRKVGIFGTAMLAVLMVFIIILGKESGFFELHTNIKATVENANNLKTGASVHFKGIKIGKVEEIHIEATDKVTLVLDIMNKHLKWIPHDSTVRITTAGIVGDKLLQIKSGTSDKIIDPNKDILKEFKEISLDSFVEKGGNIANSTAKVMVKLEKILESIEDDTLAKSLKRIDRILSRLEKKKFADSLSNFTKRIEKGPGTLHSLIYKDELHEQLVKLFDGANRNKAVKYLIRDSIKNSKKK
jgi:phospholipid/cholesterol/gamma-HCH transport system substrate-binding protein